MTRFELPMVNGESSVNRAMAEAIEANKSGLLVRTSGKLRLVQFDALMDAAKARRRLVDVNGEPVVRLGPNRLHDLEMNSLVRQAGHKFGLIAVNAGTARLFSLSEGMADPYLRQAVGVRCRRDHQPPGTPARSWYHYYPPNVRDPVKLNECVICGAYLP